MQWAVFERGDGIMVFRPEFRDGNLARHTWSIVQQRAYLLDINAAALADRHDATLTTGDGGLMGHEQDGE